MSETELAKSHGAGTVGESPKSSLGADVKSLAGKSLVYGLGSVMLRTINLLVLPLYTRFLTPADYGIVALGSTLTALLSLVLPLSLYSAVARFFFLEQSAAGRRQMLGTIWLGMLGIGLVISLALDVAGALWFGIIFPQLPFQPYGRIAIWTAYLGLFSFVPLNLLQAQERPDAYVLWSGGTLLLTVSLTVILVVFMKQGARGYLLGTLLANALLVLPYGVMTLRNADFRVDFSRLKRALAFSLPLVPHGFASWALTLSDRAILQLYVTVSALGLYSLGYTFGMIQIMISGAIGSAWVPFFLKRVAEEGDAAKSQLAKLVTYYVLMLCAVAVGLCLFARDAIMLLTPESFHAAHQVVPIIVVGYLWGGLYVIPANFLFAKSKTAWLPAVTVSAGAVNVGMNFAFIPHFGIVAAAWAAFAAFLTMLVLMLCIARRVFPFPYEYARIARIFGAGAIVIGAGLLIQLPLPVDLLWKSALFLVFPLLLVLGGFFTPPERALVSGFAADIKMRLSVRR